MDTSIACKPAGILMTPGTSRNRKTVTFGAQVVDNEGKKPGAGKSGLPSDYPGKFPSPWTPRVSDASDKSASTRLNAALYEARADSARAKEKTATRLAQAPAKARDDNDVTIDVLEPRSESGKYWKEAYETFSARSEKEVHRLVKKHQIAKQYAKKKDDEAVELMARLNEERKRHKARENELEVVKRRLERELKRATEEKEKAKGELAELRERIEGLEKTAFGNASATTGNDKNLTQRRKVEEKEESIPSVLLGHSPPKLTSPSPNHRYHKQKPQPPNPAPTAKSADKAPEPPRMTPSCSPLKPRRQSSIANQENIPPREPPIPTTDIWSAGAKDDDSFLPMPSSPPSYSLFEDYDRFALPLATGPSVPLPSLPQPKPALRPRGKSGRDAGLPAKAAAPAAGKEKLPVRLSNVAPAETGRTRSTEEKLDVAAEGERAAAARARVMAKRRAKAIASASTAGS